MRTESDLLAALAARAEAAPDPATVLAVAQQRAAGHRRRRAVTIGAVAAVTAAVLAVPALLAGEPATEPTSPAAAPPIPQWADPVDDWHPFSFTIERQTLGGYELVPTAVSADYQMAEVQDPATGEIAAYLVLYRAGSQVRVEIGRERTPGEPVADTPRLSWEWAPGAEAVLVSHSEPPLEEATLQEMADELRLVAPYAVTVPYRLEYLPPETEPFRVTRNLDDPQAFQSVLQLEQNTPDGLGFLDITVADEPVDPGNEDWDWQPTMIAGRPAECVALTDGDRCRVEIGSLTVDIGAGRLPEAELERIVTGLTPAVWEDPDTWLPLTEALPQA